MAAGTVDDPWERTLALRLRSLYGATAPTQPVDAGPLLARLQRHCDALQRVGRDRYRVDASIAAGGMGRVDAAVDVVAKRTVALKRAAPCADATELARRRLRLLGEAATLARLQHPGVVPLYDLGLLDDEPFFAMPRIDGRTLADVLAEGDADGSARPRRIELLRRVAETMAYAHAKGIVHRDLKPANVMVGAFGEVYVMDWGLATAVEGAAERAPEPAADSTPDPVAESTFESLPSDSATPTAVATSATADGDGEADAAWPSLTQSGSVLGTPAYMAPERLVADAEPGPAGDVYALGAMLYQVLTGAAPFAREPGDWSPTTILAAIRDRGPQPVLAMAPGTDPELAAICARAMQRAVAQRYASMQELADDLRAFAEHRIVRAHGAGPARHVRKWIQRNRAVAATLAATAVLLLVASSWFVVRLAVARDAARQAATVAEQRLSEVLDLAVTEQVAALRHRAEHTLWPAGPRLLADAPAWLQEAEALRPALARLERRRTEAPAAVDAEVGTAVDAAEPWRRRLLDTAIASLRDFFAALPTDAPPLPLDSTVAAVAARTEFAARLLATTTQGDAAVRWRTTIDEIARSPLYGGLVLVPQVGLLPLGADPRSGLHEFLHLASGSLPRRGANGVLSPHADHGVVLVLLPGGTFLMGAAPNDPRRPDPWSETVNEGPVHEVTLAPFLIAKFETTQAQWRRLTATSPSVHDERSDFVDERAPLHPVESVDWFTARNVARKVGLALPTEAQWEYAARAGTTTPWYTGATVDGLLQPPAGNLADARAAATLGTQGWQPTPGLDDGYVMHAPIGSFAPNPFGLHDLIGNVAEWCEDEYGSYGKPPLPGSGGRPVPEAPRTAMYRGGAFDEPAQEARSANRAGGPPSRRHFSLGVRFVRALDR